MRDVDYILLWHEYFIFEWSCNVSPRFLSLCGQLSGWVGRHVLPDQWRVPADHQRSLSDILVPHVRQQNWDAESLHKWQVLGYVQWVAPLNIICTLITMWTCAVLACRKTHSGGNEEGILKWIETGNQGAMWQEASVTVKHGEAFWVITSSGLFHQNGFRYIYTSILIVVLVLYMLCCFILLLRYILEGSIVLKAPLFKWGFNKKN